MRIQYKKYILDNKKIDIKIVHISDIHFAHKYKIKRFDMIENKIKKINPNYICITGDTIDTYDAINDPNFKHLTEFINNLSKIGKVIISIGNHEYVKQDGTGYKKNDDINWLKQLRSENIIVLDNEIYEENNVSFIGYNPNYKYYYIYKEKQPEKYNKELEKLIDKTKHENKILLVHTPTIIFTKENYKKIKNFNELLLVLSGHTHGGMIPSFIPGNFGIISPTRKLFPKYVRGRINIDNTTVIISSGVMKLSRKSKITFLNDIYGTNVMEIDTKR